MIPYHHCAAFCDHMWHDCLLWMGMTDAYTTAAVHGHLGSVAGIVCVCVCRLHLRFYCLLLSLLAHNGLTNCFPLTAPSNRGWGSGSHNERAANGQRSDVYQRLPEQRAVVCHTDACWGSPPATNHNSYTFRLQSVCSQLKRENTGKCTEDHGAWRPQNLNGTHTGRRKAKRKVTVCFLAQKAWDIAQGSFNVLNPTVCDCNNCEGCASDRCSMKVLIGVTWNCIILQLSVAF